MNTEPQPIPETTPSIFKPIGRKPTGKIAELPKAQRNIVNQMLDDGATYDAIELEMAKHGVSLNGENISNWSQNGFQQYLQHQDHIAEMRLLRENASDLVQDYNVIQFHQAANQLAVGQILKALTRQELIDDPINYVRTINALARLSRSALALKQSEDENAKAAAETSQPEPVRDPIAQRRLMFAAFEGAMGVKAAPGPIGPDLNEYLAPDRATPNSHNADLSSETPLTNDDASGQRGSPNSSLSAPGGEGHSEVAPSSFSPSSPSSPFPSRNTEHAPRSSHPASSIEHPESRSRARPSCAPASTNPQIQRSNNPPSEPCPECFASLPPLLPSGERISPHCDNCGASLRPPGAFIEYCPHCHCLLPELNTAGLRPTPDCPQCNQPLPPPPINTLLQQGAAATQQISTVLTVSPSRQLT